MIEVKIDGGWVAKESRSSPLLLNLVFRYVVSGDPYVGQYSKRPSRGSDPSIELESLKGWNLKVKYNPADPEDYFVPSD